MSFSLFFTFVMATFSSGCFFFSVLFCLGRRRAPSSLLCAPFSGFFLGCLPLSSFLYWFCCQQFAGLGSIHFSAFFSQDLFFAFLFLAVLFLAIYRAVFIYLVHFFKACAWAFPSLVIPLISGIVRAHHFSYSSLGFFVGLLVPRFSSFWFYYF